jgi:hypothetical protein
MIDLLTATDPLFVIEDSRDKKREKVDEGRSTKGNQLSESESHRKSRKGERRLKNLEEGGRNWTTDERV